MDFELNEEQRMLKESARRLMERELTPYLDSFSNGYIMNKEEIVRGLKMLQPLNYLGAMMPEEHGGGGLDSLSYAVLMEEMDYRFWGTVYLTSGSAGRVIAFGTEEQKKRLVEPLLSGDMIACSGITEPNVGSGAPRNVQFRVVPDGDHYVLNGTKVFITNGDVADVCTVIATEDPAKGILGVGSYFVEKAISPWESRRIPMIGDGPVAHVGELIFDNVRIPKENKITPEGTGNAAQNFQISMQVGRCLAGMAGFVCARKALDLAIRYAKEREQFGKKIGQFQLIQAMLAEMKALVDASRLLIYRGLDMAQRGQRCSTEASVAKFFATEAAVKVCSMAIQVHGAYGLSTEYEVERLFRHARMDTIPEGTTQIQQLIVGKELLGMSAIR
jgi:alkylation response protein AidB-like acyl-CoA dehydrogenase